MQPFLALITPVSSGEPSHPIAPGGPPPRPWGPINYPDQGLPQPPLGIWGGRPPPYVDIGFPGQQPGIWGPIYYPDQGLPGQQPGQPPRPWGPINYPDQGLPGAQPVPGRPTHPIYYPPVIWDPARPANPITSPGDPDHPGGDRQPIVEWKTAWSPSTGWIVVGVPTVPVPTPAEAT